MDSHFHLNENSICKLGLCSLKLKRWGVLELKITQTNRAKTNMTSNEKNSMQQKTVANDDWTNGKDIPIEKLDKLLKLWGADTSQSENLIPISVPVFLALGLSLPFLKIPQSHRFLKKTFLFQLQISSNTNRKRFLRNGTQRSRCWWEIYWFEDLKCSMSQLIFCFNQSFGSLPLVEKRVQTSMAKTRFLLRRKPTQKPPFYVLSCGSRIQATPVVIRW